ncbi:unnamed protein product [Rhizophagus irregularis]|nr:unnamed protein product [Rhizophagus irregularis]
MSVWTHPFIWTPTANALKGGHHTPTRTHYDLYCNPLRFMNNSSGISFFFHDSDIESWSINVVLDHLVKMEINLTSKDSEEFLDKYKAQLLSLSSQYGNSRVTKINFNGKDINDKLKKILFYQCHHWLHYFRKR